MLLDMSHIYKNNLQNTQCLSTLSIDFKPESCILNRSQVNKTEQEI